MTWTYGGVDIKVTEDSGLIPDWRIDEINPLTTAHVTYIRQAGRESYTRSLTCVCFENYPSLEALADGAAHILVTDFGSAGSWVILDIKPERLQDKRATPVVKVRLTLMEVT